MLEDEDELKRAKEAGLAISGDAQLVVTHYFLKRDENAPPEEREELIDEALRIDPTEPSAKRYTPSSIEHMTPRMREELIVRLLAEGMGRAGA